MLIFAMNYQAFIKYLLLLLPLVYPSYESTNTKQSSDWSYDDKNFWGRQFPECNGRSQSPISLEKLTVNPGSVPQLTFGNYNELLQSFILENNGHTIEGLISKTVSGDRPYITGGFLNGIFEVANFHFHWGSPSTRGSEHTINGRRFDVELHIVHKNQKYETVDEARQNSDGLAVLGIMIKAERNSNGNSPFSAYNQIFSGVSQLSEYESQIEVENTFNLEGLFGNLNTKEFFTYNGSLTTPPCSEAVTWQVFTDPIAIPYNLISRFFNVRDKNGDPVLNNYRSLQRRNFRSVKLRRPSLLGSHFGKDTPILDLPFIGPIL